jgi:hypothetical protein
MVGVAPVVVPFAHVGGYAHRTASRSLGHGILGHGILGHGIKLTCVYFALFIGLGVLRSCRVFHCLVWHCQPVFPDHLWLFFSGHFHSYTSYGPVYPLGISLRILNILTRTVLESESETEVGLFLESKRNRSQNRGMFSPSTDHPV